MMDMATPTHRPIYIVLVVQDVSAVLEFLSR